MKVLEGIPLPLTSCLVIKLSVELTVKVFNPLVNDIDSDSTLEALIILLLYSSWI